MFVLEHRLSDSPTETANELARLTGWVRDSVYPPEYDFFAARLRDWHYAVGAEQERLGRMLSTYVIGWVLAFGGFGTGVGSSSVPKLDVASRERLTKFVSTYPWPSKRLGDQAADWLASIRM